MSKINKMPYLFLLLSFALGINKSYAQNLVDDISSPMLRGDSSDIFTETIRIISRSQKIFILTNSNEMLTKGDFITLILNEREPVARALVGKTYEGLAGIKILKVYSLQRWALMRQGLDIQILKGDDSRLFAKKSESKPQKEPRIESEEDLYEIDTEMETDVDFLTKDNRHIKPDNLVGASWNQYSFEHTLTPDGESQTESHAQWAFSWAYQFSDNYWLEGLYGRVSMADFPAKGAQTLVNNFTVRLKYTFKAPLYSYVTPYVGYQIYNISSPEAGKGEVPQTNEKELDLIDELAQDQPVFGVTILRRLVPGWFLKGDIGNDILALGVAIEF